jgi:hypothetical protein
VHKETIKVVPNALEGRDSLDIHIYGMDGVPPELLGATGVKRQRVYGSDDADAAPAVSSTAPQNTMSTWGAPRPMMGAPPLPAAGASSGGYVGAPGAPGMPFLPPPMVGGFAPRGLPPPVPGMPAVAPHMLMAAAWAGGHAGMMPPQHHHQLHAHAPMPFFVPPPLLAVAPSQSGLREVPATGTPPSLLGAGVADAGPKTILQWAQDAVSQEEARARCQRYALVIEAAAAAADLEHDADDFALEARLAAALAAAN